MLLVLLLLAAAPGDWRFMNEIDGVKVYSRRSPDSPIVSMRGTGVIDAPLTKVAIVLLDDARVPEWTPDVEARVVRVVNPMEYIEHNIVKMPPLVRDRDFVNVVYLAADREHRRATIISLPAEDPAVPPNKRVRGVLSAEYELSEIDGGTRTSLTVTMHTDPKGALPAWLVNYFAREWPGEALRGIRKQSAKTDLVMPKEFSEFAAQLAW
jgi:hypothetical protein